MPHEHSDELIWSLEAGSRIRCNRDLVMDDGGERAFTAGATYAVQSMHPIADPPFVTLVNDLGQHHRLWGVHVRDYFEHRQMER